MFDFKKYKNPNRDFDNTIKKKPNAIRSDKLQEIFDDVVAVVVEQLGVAPEAVRAQSRIAENLGADSLDAAELVMALEEKFGVQIPDEDSGRFVTIADVVEYIAAKTRH